MSERVRVLGPVLRSVRVPVRMLAPVITGLLLAASPPAAGPAQAQSRPDTLKMTCAEVAALVRARGSIVLGTGPNIYDRFVADSRFCAVTEIAAPDRVRTRDVPVCRAVFRCVPRRDYWEDNFMFGR